MVGLGLGIFFVMRYAERVKQDPTKSAVHDMKAENEARFSAQGTTDEVAMTGRHKTVWSVWPGVRA